MQIRKLASCAFVALALMMTGIPAQAGVVSTAQMQTSRTIVATDIAGQRDWIFDQLVEGGVAETDARLRVAALTDAQVVQLHQRIDQEPAGGNALLWIVVLVLISELVGWTDFIPAIRPAD